MYEETIDREGHVLVTNSGQVFKVSVLQAMKWARLAWTKHVSVETIQHCFDKALPSTFRTELNAEFDEQENQETVEDELHGHISGIYGMHFTDTEYDTMIGPELEKDPLRDAMSTNDVVELVLDQRGMSEQVCTSHEESLEALPEYTFREKMAHLNAVLTFLDDENDFDTKRALRERRDQYRRSYFSQQSSIDDFFL